MTSADINDAVAYYGGAPGGYLIFSEGWVFPHPPSAQRIANIATLLTKLDAGTDKFDAITETIAETCCLPGADCSKMTQTKLVVGEQLQHNEENGVPDIVKKSQNKAAEKEAAKQAAKQAALREFAEAKSKQLRQQARVPRVPQTNDHCPASRQCFTPVLFSPRFDPPFVPFATFRPFYFFVSFG